MQIAPGLEMLVLTPPNGGAPYHPTVLYDENSLVLVDTGLPGFYDRIIASIQQAGLSPAKLTAIVITHQDIDHLGSLPQFLGAPSGERLDVYAHEADKPVVDGHQPIIKVPEERLNLILGMLPETLASQYRSVFSSATSDNVNRLLVDGERLPFGGGVTVIHTPGHTPGHVSLYHQPSKTLIAGDAMIVKDGELDGPIPGFTPDLNEALRSLGKLAAYDIETVICYHGGIYRGQANERIAELAAQAN
ncbi:MBL fold metallo-hydrolase [Cohnella endophytica]|uniref:MBL fold metallo-hydrolase n=1 Tax=Cohnella endophytica TaxID=2419778 RepID=A0A494XHC6_9BACL|nr:MBL fold metallo-hydrolase [Cohnella endophytica]RKP48006.1 MBL fold metallo-hydrolase [Cohnella endophytica]